MTITSHTSGTSGSGATTTSVDRRRQLLQEQSVLNGIDYVEVVTPPAGQPATQLRVTFVNPLTSLPTPIQVSIAGGDRIPVLQTTAVAATEDPDTVLVTLAGGGDLSTYTLSLVRTATDPTPPTWVDPVLSSACFTFGLDCATDEPCEDVTPCPPAVVAEPKLDYLARDWTSLRAVLLDRLSVLQPEWSQRAVPDVRLALVELLAELGDRASYHQDAVATEAYLGTARRRTSVRRHARLVDYWMSEGTNARVWVQLKVPEDVELLSGPSAAVVPAGTRLLTGKADAPTVIAAGSTADAEARRAGALEFETMHDLHVVCGAHSELRFHTWSGTRPALPAGATSATLVGHLPHLAPGQVLLLVEHRDPVGEEKAVAGADPTRRHAVRLATVDATAVDVLTGEPITEITWSVGDALPWPLLVEGEATTPDRGRHTFLDGALALGNIVLADHGRRAAPVLFGPVPESGRFEFRFPEGPLTQVARQVLKVELADGSGHDQRIVTFDPSAAATAATEAAPDVVLPDVHLTDSDGQAWHVRRDLISSGTSRDVVVEIDDNGLGSLRFGRESDGALANGQPPHARHLIRATYRIGNGTVGNVAAEAIHTLLDGGTVSAALREVLVEHADTCRVWNPLPATGGTEPETIEQVRQRAPVAFRTQQRCVTAADYAAQAERFGPPRRIQRAVATIRWTGSWFVVVVAVDPVGSEKVDKELLAQVTDYLDPFRMAGHDLQVVPAQYAALDVGLAVQLDDDYRRDLVRADLLDLMSNRRLPDGRLGLFHPDRLTFGTTVYLGPIIAAAQQIPGVARVEATRFSRHRQPGTDARATGRIEIGPSEIARLSNDPSRPELGRFHLDSLVGGR